MELTLEKMTDRLNQWNQLAGVDLRWKFMDAPIALYCQVEDEDKFLPNCLMFQYGIEGWRKFNDSTIRLFVEYADLTSYWWTGDPTTRNVSYGHHIYSDGYRFRGRPIGHWADQDSQIISLGGLILNADEVGWGATIRNGKLNEDGKGSNSISDGFSSDHFDFEIYNFRSFSKYDPEVQTAVGWEKIKANFASNSEKRINI